MKSNEKNFIKRLKKKREDAIEYIYDNYIAYVKSIITNVLGRFNDNGLIEECINDVFISVWNNSNKFSGDNYNFKNWICAIARFKSIDYYRQKIKNTEQYLNDFYFEEKYLIEDEILIMENKEFINKLLNTLDDTDREIFILKYYMGMKTEEISSKLNLSLSSVSSRLYRGKKKLKSKISEPDAEGIYNERYI